MTDAAPARRTRSGGRAGRIALRGSAPDDARKPVRAGLEGNLCRCTGYHNIVKAVLHAAGQGGDQ